jgi:hypothetical protein
MLKATLGKGLECEAISSPWIKLNKIKTKTKTEAKTKTNTESRQDKDEDKDKNRGKDKDKYRVKARRDKARQSLDITIRDKASEEKDKMRRDGRTFSLL